MKFEVAVHKSIKSFLEGKIPEKLMDASGGELLYTPEYMDELEEALLNEEVVDDGEETDL